MTSGTRSIKNRAQSLLKLKRRSILFWFALALSFSWTSNAYAKWYTGRNIWIVGPAGEQGQVVTASDKFILFRSNTFPEESVLIEAAVFDKKGNILLTPGSQLAKSPPKNTNKILPDAQVFCTEEYGPTPPPNPRRILFGSTALMCLIDADNDSAFEAYYYVYSTAASLSVQAGTLFNIKPIQKLPYKPLNREKYETSLERFIVYIGKSKKGNFIFAEGFGEKNTEFNDKTAINSYLSLSSIQLGKSFDLFGITVEPISSTDKSLILKIVKPSEQHAEQVDINLEYRVYVTLY